MREDYTENGGGHPPGGRFEGTLVDSRTFAAARRAPAWLARDVLVAGQPGVIGGPMKCLKTSIAVDLAVSLGSGTPFLGTFAVPRPVRVAVLSGETGEPLQGVAARLCAAKGLRLEECDAFWGFDLPPLGDARDRQTLAAALSVRRVRVVIIDPLYLCLFGGGGASTTNLYEVGPLLRGTARACLAAGATPLFVHHTTKQVVPGERPLTLEDLAFAGIGEFARQWLLLSRRQRFVPGTGAHRLLMAVGGSAGHAGCWQVDIEEGVLDGNFGGRRWEVRVGPFAPAAGRRRGDA